MYIYMGDTCGKAELWCFVGFLMLARFTIISPEFHHNFTGISPEFIRNHRNVTIIVTRISPEFRQNIELEHLKKGDNHNSAFPQ